MEILHFNDSSSNLINWLDAIVFFIFLLTILYLFFFTIVALVKKVRPYPQAKKESKFAILYLWKGDFESFKSNLDTLFAQSYTRDNYTAYVISTSFSKQERARLKSLNVELFESPESDSITEMLDELTEFLENNGTNYDAVMLLDTNSGMGANCLAQVNDALYNGCYVVQGHSIMGNKNSAIETLRATSAEINNTIFRLGHTAISLSSAIFNIGITYDFQTLRKCIQKQKLLGLEKQLEQTLLKNNYYIEYLENVHIYKNGDGEKELFASKRLDLKKIQLVSRLEAFKAFPGAILNGNIDYANKLVQWMLPSRIVMLLLIILLATVISMIDIFLGLKWWVLLVMLFLTFVLAIPRHMLNLRFAVLMFFAPITLSFHYLSKLVRRK